MEPQNPKWTPEQLARWTPEELEKGRRIQDRINQAAEQALQRWERAQASASPDPKEPIKPTMK